MADDFIKAAFLRAAGPARSTAGFQRSRPGLIFIAAGLEQKGLLRDARGRFQGAGLQGDLAQANARMARELAESVADAQAETMRRPGVSSGRLHAALMSPRNRTSNQFGFGVGVPEFLDSSVAKYWRQIDQGFKGHVGREIRGVWGGTLTGAYAQAPSGAYPMAGAPITSFGEGAGGKLIPLGAKSAYARLRAVQEGRPSTKPGVKGVISKPISPQQYFRRGWEDFNVKDRYKRTVREVISANFGGRGIPTKGQIAFMSGKAGAKRPSPGRQFR